MIWEHNSIPIMSQIEKTSLEAALNEQLLQKEKKKKKRSL